MHCAERARPTRGPWANAAQDGGAAAQDSCGRGPTPMRTLPYTVTEMMPGPFLSSPAVVNVSVSYVWPQTVLPVPAWPGGATGWDTPELQKTMSSKHFLTPEATKGKFKFLIKLFNKWVRNFY